MHVAATTHRVDGITRRVAGITHRVAGITHRVAEKIMTDDYDFGVYYESFYPDKLIIRDLFLNLHPKSDNFNLRWAPLASVKRGEEQGARGKRNVGNCEGARGKEQGARIK